MNVTPQDLFGIIGALHVENTLLKAQLASYAAAEKAKKPAAEPPKPE